VELADTLRPHVLEGPRPYYQVGVFGGGGGLLLVPALALGGAC
jgi:hypothetical protein